MKKMLLVLGVAAAAMTSCTSDEVLEMNPTNVIKFESFVNKGTRAVTETDAINFSQFYVFGYYKKDQTETKVFNNCYVRRTADTHEETVDNIKNIWETDPSAVAMWTANTYYFGAYATKNESDKIDNGVGFSDGKLSFTDYVVKDENDLVAAVKTVNNASLTNPYVDLTFKHLLSQVKFTFTNQYLNAGYTMHVSDITFSIKKQADCTYDGINITWGNTKGDNETISYAGTGDIANNIMVGASYTSEAHLMIPQTIPTDVKASFTITFYDTNNSVVDVLYFTGENSVSLIGNDQTTSVTEWQPGYIYNYKADLPISPNAIKFTTSVESWLTTDVEDKEPGNEKIEF